MIPLFTRAAVRRIDVDSVERLALPSLVLMENAGMGAMREIEARFAERLSRVVLVGGVGQNGGDAWVVARALAQRGLTPRCVLVGAPESVRGDAAINLEVVRRLGLRVELAHDTLDALDRALEDATLVVDGLFGTGLDRPLTGLYAQVVARLDAQPAPVCALDLPSGIDADTGAVLGAAVHAALTVTFAAHKRGLHQYPAVQHAGEVVLVPIGVPVPDVARAHLFEPEDVGGVLRPRALDAHKGTAGHVLVVAGSPGRTGAAWLSAHAALRAGAGLVTLAARGEARAALDAKVIEVMTDEIPPEGALAHVVALASRKAAAIVGPGLGLDDAGRALSRGLASSLPIPAVLDADALTAIGTDLEHLRHAAAPRVLTPHPAEAARLLGTTTEAVQTDRYAAAIALASRAGQVVVLKGARTVIAAADGRLRVCRRGTPALGVAGTGDVLAGLVGALLAGEDPFEAASVAVLVHALAGERAAVGDRGLLAREVADAVPAVLAAALQAR